MRYWIANSRAGFRIPKAKCPECGRKRLSAYFDRRTGDLMPTPEFGRCERINSCTYDNDPNKILGPGERLAYTPRPLPPPKEPMDDYRIPDQAFQSTFKDHSKNNLFRYLEHALPKGLVTKALADYRVGTYLGKRTEMHGAAFFWLIGADGGIRTGHAIYYKENGKRIKESDDAARSCDNLWAHHAVTGKSSSALEINEPFFGEHLLPLHPEKVVAIVESEKTALIASMFYPGMIWLATGGKDKLTRRKMRAVRGRHVVLYPDLDEGYTRWRHLSEDLSAYFLVDGSLTVSDVLFTIQGPGDDGADIADFLLPVNRIEQCDLDILPPQAPEPEEVPVPEPPAPEPDPMPPVLRRMIAKNPAIQNLIHELDLDTTNITVTTLPGSGTGATGDPPAVPEPAGEAGVGRT